MKLNEKKKFAVILCAISFFVCGSMRLSNAGNHLTNRGNPNGVVFLSGNIGESLTLIDAQEDVCEITNPDGGLGGSPEHDFWSIQRHGRFMNHIHISDRPVTLTVSTADGIFRGEGLLNLNNRPVNNNTFKNAIVVATGQVTEVTDPQVTKHVRCIAIILDELMVEGTAENPIISWDSESPPIVIRVDLN